MTLTIENANEKFLPLFEEIAKLSNARLIVNDEPLHETIGGTINEAIDEFLQEQKEGKTKRYKSFDEFEKAMQEG